MPLPLIPLALSIAQVAAPSLVRWLGGDKAGDVAQTVVDTAVAVTGAGDGPAALAALRTDPEAMLAFQAAMLDHEAAWWAEETKRLAIVNDTIRAEVASDDPFVRRMRPTFGYIMAVAFGAQMLTLSYLVVVDPGAAATVAISLADLTWLWGIGLAVLGVYVHARSKEKGVEGGALGSILSALPLPRRRP